jgi:hypothetical protein
LAAARRGMIRRKGWHGARDKVVRDAGGGEILRTRRDVDRNRKATMA